MQCYTFAALAILAIIMGQMPQTHAGLSLPNLGGANKVVSGLGTGNNAGFSTALGGLGNTVTNVAGVSSVGNIGTGLGNALGNLGNTVGTVAGAVGNTVGTVVSLVLGGANLAPDSKVVTIRDSNSSIVGHFNGPIVSSVQQVIPLSGDAIYLKASSNNDVEVRDKSGAVVTTLTGATSQALAALALQCGGQISMEINRLGAVVNDRQAVVDAKGNTIDQFTPNSVQENGIGGIIMGSRLLGLPKDVFGLAVELEKLKLNILGSGLSNALSLVSGGAQVVGKVAGDVLRAVLEGGTGNENSQPNLQLGSPLALVRDADGNNIVILGGGRIIAALQQLFNTYGSNIYLALASANSGTVYLLNEAGNVLSALAGYADFTTLVQESGGKMTLIPCKLGVVTNTDGKNVVVALANNGKPLAVISGNQISVVDIAPNGEKSIVVGSQTVGSVLVSGLFGKSGSGSTGGSNGGQTGGQTGGSGSVSSGGSNGGQIGGQTGGQTDGSGSGATGGSNIGGGILGDIGSLVGGVTNILSGGSGLGGIGGLTDGSGLGGLTGGLTGGSVLGGLAGGLTGGSGLGGLAGGLTGGSGLGGLAGGLSPGSGLGGIGGLTGGSGLGGLTGGLTGGSVLGGLTEGLTGGSGLGGLTGGLTGGSVLGGLTEGLTGGSGLGGLTGGLTGGAGSGGIGGLTGGSGSGGIGGLTGSGGSGGLQ